jgi:CheY-like chemotaxis protein
MTERGCVLVVDDEEGIRDTLREVVEMGGCSAVLAANGAEALRLMARQRPCLVIIDLLMPVLSGAELIATMRSRPELADIPFIVSTSAPSRAPRGIPVLAKPVDIPAVWEWMRRTCHCGQASEDGS